jgi:hypothetical protein
MSLDVVDGIDIIFNNITIKRNSKKVAFGLRKSDTINDPIQQDSILLVL